MLSSTDVEKSRRNDKMVETREKDQAGKGLSPGGSPANTLPDTAEDHNERGIVNTVYRRSLVQHGILCIFAPHALGEHP